MNDAVSSVAPSTSGPGDDAIGLVLGDQRARFVQRPVGDDERVAARELAIVEVLGRVRARGVAEPVDGLREVDEADDEGEAGAQHDAEPSDSVGPLQERGEVAQRERRPPRRGDRVRSRDEDRDRVSARRRAQRAYAAIVASVDASQESSRRAFSRPARPRRSRSSGSSRRRSSAARNAAGSRGGTSSPVTPSSTASTSPPTADATTGRP